MSKKPKTLELETEPEVSEPTNEELELAELVDKCLNVHGDPKDGATHGEIERIRYLESITKKT